MVIDLTELKQRETIWKKQAGPEEIGLQFPDFVFTEPVKVDLRITRAETQFVIRGQISTIANTNCVKCLTPFTLPVAEDIGWAVQVIENVQARLKEEDTEDYWFIEKGSAQLDITDRVRESILVGLPYHPVCTSECRGLCARCGANLNEETCTCDTPATDGRWGPLKEIMDKQLRRGE